MMGRRKGKGSWLGAVFGKQGPLSTLKKEKNFQGGAPGFSGIFYKLRQGTLLAARKGKEVSGTGKQGIVEKRKGALSSTVVATRKGTSERSTR